jgi:hypothetical protein
MLSMELESKGSGKLNLAPLFGDERANLITSDTDGTIEITNMPPGSYSAALALKNYTFARATLRSKRKKQRMPISCCSALAMEHFRLCEYSCTIPRHSLLPEPTSLCSGAVK